MGINGGCNKINKDILRNSNLILWIIGVEKSAVQASIPFLE
jgi:hypothetical protein